MDNKINIRLLYEKFKNKNQEKIDVINKIR